MSKQPKDKPDPAPPQSGPFPADAIRLADAAALAHRSRQRLREWCIQGRLPYWRIGQSMLIRRKAARRIGRIQVSRLGAGNKINLPDFNDLL